MPNARDNGAVPEEEQPLSTSQIVILQGRRIDNLETVVVGIKASNERIADGLLVLHKDMGDIKLAMATDAGKEAAIEGVKKAYVRPVLLLALVAVLSGGISHIISAKASSPDEETLQRIEKLLKERP